MMITETTVTSDNLRGDFAPETNPLENNPSELTPRGSVRVITPHDVSSYRNTLIGTLAVDGWPVTFGTARRGLGGAAARPGPSSLYRM